MLKSYRSVVRSGVAGVRNYSYDTRQPFQNNTISMTTFPIVAIKISDLSRAFHTFPTTIGKVADYMISAIEACLKRPFQHFGKVCIEKIKKMAVVTIAHNCNTEKTSNTAQPTRSHNFALFPPADYKPLTKNTAVHKKILLYINNNKACGHKENYAVASHLVGW